ncbi:MAG: DUF1569 domain-containing protein [Pirellulales bacterium]
MINTRQVRGRRKLRFHDFDELLVDVRRLHAGPHRQLGNWSLAQIAKHLGRVMHGSIDGSPSGDAVQFPLLSRIVGRLILRPFLLNVAVPAGIKPPDAVRREFMFDQAEFDDALACLETGVARLRQETTRVIHPLLGRLSPAQWDKFHLRHSEMHLGFIVPQ